MAGEQMSFWGHLDALRGIIVRILVVTIVLGIGFFTVMPWLFDHVIAAPCTGDFILYRWFGFLHGDGTWLPDMGADDFSVRLINIELASQFMIHLSASFYLAMVVAFPYIIYELWTFVSPALYENEKRGARKAFIFGNIMFYLGMAVGYFLVFPLSLRFLADYHLSDNIDNTVSLTSYMDAFYMLVFMMGIIFELPLVAWMLGKIGILRRGFFSTFRRGAIVAILVLAAIITPTGDIFTLFVVFLPIYLLWEFSALLVPASAPDDAPDEAPDSDQTT